MPKNFFRIVFSLFLLVLCTTYAIAQTETPEQFAERYLAATNAKDWKTLAQLIHTEAREQFKKIFADIIAGDKSMKVANDFFNVRSKQEFDALPAEIVVERMMQNLSKTLPSFDDALANARSRIIGHVREEQDLAYVVYKIETSLDGATFMKLSVMPLKKDKDSWRALLSGNMENLTQLFQQQKTNPPPPVRNNPRKKSSK